jgi:fructokinase
MKAGIEAGGTKFVCGVGTEDGELVKSARIETAEPRETLAKARDFFLGCRAEGLSFDALGIGSFGPVDMDPLSPTWGYITSTPKPRWANTDVASYLSRELDLPVAFATDVQTAAIYEASLGSARGLDPVVYFTVGTGIGGGLLVDGKLVRGPMHQEMGHVFLKRHPKDGFAGFCPFHGDCAEGLAAGPAMQKRWGRPASELPMDHEAWEIEAWYIAQLAVNAQMMIAPKAIVLGGGVTLAPGVIGRVRAQAAELAAGYLAAPNSLADWENIIRPASHPAAGLLGTFILAANEARRPADGR